MESVNHLGIDWDGPIPVNHSNTVQVDITILASDEYGVDLYIRALFFLHNHT